MRPHLDYGNIIYDQPNNENNATHAIAVVIKGTSQGKFYSELGLQFLKFRRWFRKLSNFLKIKKTGIYTRMLV